MAGLAHNHITINSGNLLWVMRRICYNTNSYPHLLNLLNKNLLNKIYKHLINSLRVMRLPRFAEHLRSYAIIKEKNMIKQLKFFKFQQLANFKKAMICLIAFTIIAGLWHVYGYNLKNKFAKADNLASVTVAPAVDNVDNLAGNTNATWRFTINNVVALSSSTNAVEITFPDTIEGSWNLSGIVASSTTADPTLEFATTSVAVLGQKIVVIMVSEDQTNANNAFILDIKGVGNPMLEAKNLTNYNWAIKTCVLTTHGDPSSGCASDLDSAVTASASITRRGGIINDWTYTPSTYAANATGVEYTITFTASTTLNVGEKIHINFPAESFIANATTSLQTIVEGGTAQVAADAIATSTGYGLYQVILTLSGGAIDPSATSTVTIVIGNITNPTKGSYGNLRVFTTTADNGLVDGAFFGIEAGSDNGPLPVDSILIGGEKKYGAKDKTTLPEIIEETKKKIAEIVNKDSMTAQELAEEIITIAYDAAEIVKANINALLGKLGFKRDLAKEQVSVKKYVKNLIKDAAGLPEQSQHALTNFIAYGTETTLGLGEGERAGVINSFKSAFENLPTTEEDWNDVIKIANGRWPDKQSEKAEERANINFRAVYLREPDRSNPHDDAAITVMAYGLRPANRNLNSEKAAIRIFKDIYGYNPEKAAAWDVARAIAYSGATR